MSITAMIIEDVPALRQHARMMLQRTMGDQIHSIIEAENGEDAIELFNQHKPQFIIMDTVIPGMSGVKVAQHIWSRAAGTKILFWVNAHREFHIKELKRILPEEAVDGYLLQTADDDKFARAIESVLRFSNPFIDPNLRSSNVSFNPMEMHLTEVEQETLGDLLLGLTDKAIAKKRNLTVRGVQNRLASLATKLLGRDRSQVESGIEFYNLRVRMIFEALKRGVYTIEDIPELEKNLYCWMESTTSSPSQAYSLSR